jgi:thimet oligopeptidase
MSRSRAARTASLGDFPFSLAPSELRRRGLSSLEALRSRLDSLIRTDPPWTVEGFFDPLNRILIDARDVGLHGALLFQVHPDAETRVAGREVSESSDRFFNELRTNTELFRRLSAIDLAREDPTNQRAVSNLLRDMRRAGVEQPPLRREELLALSNQLDSLSNQFNANISSGERTIAVEGPDGLRGLPDDYRASHPTEPDGKVRISTKYPDCFPVMSYADDDEVRRRMLLAFLNVAFPENPPVLAEILQHRRRFSELLGYPDYAEYAVEDKMTGRAEVVTKFLDRIVRLVREPASTDRSRLLSCKQREHPGSTRLEDWDAAFWTSGGYYDTKIRNEEYGVDLRQLRAYLPYPRVRDGLFDLCRQLFGLEFHRHRSTELWHPTVDAYDVERAGEPVGRVYFDLVPRPDKYNHAAQFDVRTGVSGGGLPQGALICNFLDPATPVDDARMEYRDVVTFFHEFGHLVHHLLSGHGRWLSTSMGSVEWDFIEAPSQLFEEWARDPATLARFARNPDTGETIPADVVARLKESDAVGRASWVLRQAALASLSLEIHRREPSTFDSSELFRELFEQTTDTPLEPQYHPVARFGHLTGYSAIYYTYLWSAVIARDLLTPFYEKGSLTDRETAERYAREVLAPGGSRPAAELIRSFLGRDYSFDAFERWALEGSVPAAPTARG